MDDVRGRDSDPRESVSGRHTQTSQMNDYLKSRASFEQIFFALFLF